MNRRSLILSGLSLPFLSTLSAKTKIATKTKIKKNVVFICLDFGFMRQDLFWGKNGDCDSPYFDILKDMKGKYTFFHSIHQPNLSGSHSAHPGALSCVKPSQMGTFQLESIDQYIGSRALRENRHKTINFVTSTKGRINWNSSGQRVPALPTVTALHKKLFGEVDTKQELAAAEEQLKILSRAHGEIARKGSTDADKMLASSLQVKLDELKEDLFWIEKGQPDVSVEIDPTLGKEDQHARLGTALSLCTEAFKYKLSKVASISFDANGSITLKGVNTGYHGLSHKSKNPESMLKKQIVDEFILKSVMTQVKDLEKRQMLTDTIVVVTGAMGDAASHSNKKLPVFLMGGGLKHQGVMNCMEGKKLKISLADVYQTVVAELGLPPMELPYCKGPVKELLS